MDWRPRVCRESGILAFPCRYARTGECDNCSHHNFLYWGFYCEHMQKKTNNTSFSLCMIMPKDATWSAILSALIPGLGQAYNGQVFKGDVILVVFAISAMLSGLLLLVAIAIWIYGIYNAYSTSTKMNQGEIPFVATSMKNIILFFAIPIGLFLIIVIFSFIILGSGFFTTVK